MTRIKVNRKLLKKYFSEHIDFESKFERHFKKSCYNLEKSEYKGYSIQYKDISDLCIEFKLEKYVNIFFNLFFIGLIVKFRNEFASPHSPEQREPKEQIEYKRELFSLFKIIYRSRYGIDLSFDSIIVKTTVTKIQDKIKEDEDENKKYKVYDESANLKVADSILKEKFEKFILNAVADIFYQKTWDKLSGEFHLDGNEKSNVIDRVEQWLEIWEKQKKGQPSKYYYTKPFIKDIEKFILNEIKEGHFNSDRELHLFIGKLTVLYEILPPPNKIQLEKGNDYFIKLIENQLPKKVF